MPKGAKQILIGVAAFIVAAGLLFSGNLVYENYQIKKPVVEKINSLPGVTGVQLVSGQGKPELLLTITGDVDVVKIWNQVVDALKDVPGGPGAFELKVAGSGSSETVTQALAEMQFTLEEALATGTYTKIPTALQEVRETYGVSGQAVLAEDLLLLTLADHDSRVYKVVQLPPAMRDNQYNG